MGTAHINGMDFDYDDVGPGDGPVVLLLHGFPQDRTSWRLLTPGLVEAGYRVIALDQRGYSPGARPGATSDYRLAPLVSDVVGLLDVLEVPGAHVVGHDWGGAVAWAVASEAPDRVLTLTVLSTPHPGAMTRAFTRTTQGLRSWYMGMFQVPVLAEQVLQPGRPFWSAVMRGLPTDAVAHYSERAREPGALTAMLRWYRALPRDMVRPSLAMHRITVPTLYIWGRNDPALGEGAALLTADFVTGPYTFVALPGQGHWLPERAADEVLPLVLDHLGAHD
jgi:pimeloyl-ACP methyl ester carboxylesterase